MENQEQKESNLRLCKRCNEVKRRTLSGKYPDNRDKKYVGDDGLLWNGSTCGICNRKRAKEIMAARRLRQKETPKV